MTEVRPQFWLWALPPLILGLALRLWFVAHHPAFAGDALIYGAIARNLLQHGVYGFDQQTTSLGALTFPPTLIRLPGYPLFLAACFRLFGIENYAAVLHVQLVADTLTCVLVALLSRRLFGPRAALAVLWLAELCPFTANYVATPITETLVLTTIALAMYSFARWQAAGGGYTRWLWALAASLAASLLLRPEQGLLAAAFLPAVLWISFRTTPPTPHRLLASTGPALAASLCIILPLLPWTARNWRTFHSFQPLAPRSACDPGEIPPTGFNLWFRTWGIDFASTDQVYWKINGEDITPNTLPDRAFALSCTAPRNLPRRSLPLYAATTALLDDYNQTDNNLPLSTPASPNSPTSAYRPLRSATPSACPLRVCSTCSSARGSNCSPSPTSGGPRPLPPAKEPSPCSTRPSTPHISPSRSPDLQPGSADPPPNPPPGPCSTPQPPPSCSVSHFCLRSITPSPATPSNSSPSSSSGPVHSCRNATATSKPSPRNRQLHFPLHWIAYCPRSTFPFSRTFV